MIAAPSEEHLRVLLRGVDIPPCPSILLDLDSELKSDDPDQRKIASLISKDVGLAGQVMQIANSPAFGVGRPVESIIQALAILGNRQVFNLVVTQLLKTALSGGDAIQLDRFWDNSARTAAVCAELAKRLECLRPDQAYTFGLFRDCGIPLLLMRFPFYRDFLEEATTAAERKFTAVEEAGVGTHHAVVGYFLARRWRLPEFVAGAILAHHDYELLMDESAPQLPDSRIVIALNALAEYVVSSHLSQEGGTEWEKAEPHVREFFGLSESELVDLVDDLLEWLELRERR